jgi:hypothetical protein
VALYGLNYGSAARSFESAHAWTTSAINQFRVDGDEQMAAKLAQAVGQIEQARALAASVNPDANSRAAGAEAVVDAVLHDAGFDLATARPQ